jgi:two-component system OmpR family sensor kinase
MKPSLKGFFLALVPLLAGVLLSVLIFNQGQPLTMYQLQFDLSSLLWLAGALLTAWLLSLWLVRRLAARRFGQHLSQQQHEQDEAHRRFLRRLDHEMKNPLTALRALLANLEAADLPDERRTLVHDAHRQAQRLSRLGGDLRKLAELDDRPLEWQPVDMPELLNEVVESMLAQPEYSGRQLKCSIAEVPWRLPPVTGDRDLLLLAFYNLVSNALKFSRAEDVVEVRAAEAERTVVVEVADNGPGIEPDDLPRVFEELFRGANARGSEGSGLGLALVQRVVALHGGEVSVQSRRDGQRGALFTVRLPLAGDVTKR